MYIKKVNNIKKILMLNITYKIYIIYLLDYFDITFVFVVKFYLNSIFGLSKGIIVKKDFIWPFKQNHKGINDSFPKKYLGILPISPLL